MTAPEQQPAREYPAAREYAELVHALAEVAGERSGEARTIEKSYVDGCAGAARAVSDAAAAVADAATRARAAATLVTDADADASTLWRELGRVLGRPHAARLGPLPPPVRTDETDPSAPLNRAADLIAAADAPTAEGLPLAGYPLLALLGAGCALAVALPAKAVLALAGSHLLVAVLAQLLIFVAPFVGLPVARRFVARRWRTTLEFAAFVLTALGGMVACCSVVVLF